jgi:hypothetical protein
MTQRLPVPIFADRHSGNDRRAINRESFGTG